MNPGGRPSSSGEKGQPGGESGQKSAGQGGSGPKPGGAHQGGSGKTGTGGGGATPGDTSGSTAEDKTKPSPRAVSPPERRRDRRASNKPPSELVLRRIEELLKNDKVTPELEKETGMSREQMEQFVQKFKPAPKADPGAGREIDVKPGTAATSRPPRTCPALRRARA